MNKPPIREGFVKDEPVEIEATATETPPPPLPEDEWPLIVPLRKPISRNGSAHDMVKELSFREPTTGDLLTAGGNPVGVEMTELNSAGDAIYNWKMDDAKMVRLMASLSGILEPFLKKMDPRDYTTAAYRLRRFFMPG
jgi:hypothetical protein